MGRVSDFLLQCAPLPVAHTRESVRAGEIVE